MDRCDIIKDKHEALFLDRLLLIVEQVQYVCSAIGDSRAVPLAVINRVLEREIGRWLASIVN